MVELAEETDGFKIKKSKKRDRCWFLKFLYPKHSLLCELWAQCILYPKNIY